jgi:chaperonin GroES
MIKIKPLGNRVLVRRMKAQTTKGGILLPDTAQEKPKMGTVEAVGPGKSDDKGNFEPTSVKVGNKVLFSSYSGTEVKESDAGKDEELLLISEDDILGILNA